MKLYKSIFAMLAVGAVSGAFVSCDDDFDRPPVIVPEATYEVNTPMAEFKQLFWDVAQSNSTTTIPVNANGDSIIIGGRVVSSDRYGNVYQHLYVEDESGAMDFRIYSSNIYESYSPGQEVRVNVTGLLVGGYGTQMQVGTTYNGGIGGMDMDVFKIRAQRNGLPNAKDAEPETVTLQDLASWINDKDKQIYWQCRLVKIENVTFGADGGVKGWCEKPGEKNTTTRKLTDADGLSIDVRTSDMCKFNKQILPKGTGSVIAILGYYKNNSGNPSWQLTIMDPQSGCIDGFEFVDAPENPDVPGGSIFNQSFKDGIGNFTIKNDNLPSELDAVWKHDSKYGYMIATAYVSSSKVNYASDSWLISPEIDLSSQSAAFLNFDQAMNFFSNLESAKSETSVNIREVGSAEWTKLAIPAYPASMSWDFTNSGDIDLAAYVGKKVEIGFHYTSTDAKAGTWEVKNVSVQPTGSSTPVTPPSPGDGTLYSALGEAESSIDWTYENNSVENVSAIWSWKEYQGSHYLNASAYVKMAYASTAYAVSPVIDLTAAKSAKLTFDHAAKFQTTLRTLCTAVVREEGASAWTELTIPTWPNEGSWTFVSAGEIDLSAYAGKKIQLGFKYGSTADGADTWEIKNLKITE